MRDNGTMFGRQYFGEFLANLRGQLLIPYLKQLSCAFAVRLIDTDDPPWVVHVREGRLVETGEGTADCTFVLATPTLRSIVRGELPPEHAFFEMKVDVQGDMELGLKLSTVLAPFFRRYPYRDET